MNEISVEELFRMPKSSYELIDIQDEGLTLYGMIPGALHICFEELQSERCEKIGEIPSEKKLIFYCQIGRKTRDMDDLACLQGRDCFSLAGGYIGYIRSGLSGREQQKERQRKAEESIRKKYHTLLDFR